MRPHGVYRSLRAVTNCPECGGAMSTEAECEECGVTMCVECLADHLRICGKDVDGDGDGA